MSQPIPIAALVSFVACISACNTGKSGDATPHAEPTTTSVAASAVAQAATPASDCGNSGSDTCGAAKACDGPQEGGCGCGSEPARDSRIRQATDPVSGQPMLVVGAELSGAAPVTVQQLLAHPDQFAGQRVRLEGDVSAMCHHKRRWFAVQDPGDRSGRYVRVMTAPAFLVPPQSIGKKARTEGLVEVVDVPGSTERHLAQDHGLGSAPAETQKRVVLRATGAELI